MGNKLQSYKNDEYIKPVNPANIIDMPSEAFQIEANLLPLKSFISASPSQQTLPCLLRVSSVGVSEQLIESTRLGIDLVCVVDISGSMRGNKIQLCRQTLEFLTDSLNDNDRLSIVLFENSATVLQFLVKCSEENKPKIVQNIQTINAHGGTNIQSGLEESLKILSNRRYKNNLTAVMLLTDGRDNHSNSINSRVKNTIKLYQNRIGEFKLHCFGYGQDHDSELLSNMADMQNGNFYYVEDYNSIGETFASCLGELVSIVADNIQVRLEQNEAHPECTVSQIFGNDGNEHFTMPTLFSGSSKNKVFEISINPFEFEGQEYELAPITAHIQANLVRLDQIYRASCDLNIIITPRERAEQINIDVLTQYTRSKVATTINLASQLFDQGEMEQGRALLEDLLVEVGNSEIRDTELGVKFMTDIRECLDRTNQSHVSSGTKAKMISMFKGHMMEKGSPTNAAYQNQVQRDYAVKSKGFFS